MSFDLGTIHGSIDLDLAAFDKKYAQVEAALKKIEAAKGAEVKVSADTDQAQRRLDGIEAFTSGVIDGMSAEIQVAADTSKAEQGLDDVTDKAGKAGDDAGGRMGDGMVAGILAGLASIPIAGAVVQIGQSIAGGLIGAIQDGLQVEVTRDLFSAKTGLDETTAARFGRAAGSAYGDAFGESVEGNLDTARNALQTGLIDADATSAEIEKVIGSLDTVATILDEDIPRVSRAAGVMLKTGLAVDAQDAFDQMVAGAQAGANVSEDLLDTFTEYPAVFARLGLDGPVAMGLISQAMEAGARDTDYAADALKEFQIRATDGSKASAEAFELLGMNAEDMTAKIALGGQDAYEGLGLVLEGLRAIEDPVKRNEAAVGLFGTKAEDLGDALFAMDTSTAVQQLGNFEGAAKDAMGALADNPATAIESAKRNLEVAADGIKGALASAFSEPLVDLSNWVSNNSAGVLEFFGSVATVAFDVARGGVEMSATLIEAIGQIPSAFEPVLIQMQEMLGTYDLIARMVPGMPRMPEGVMASIAEMRGEIDGVAESANTTADALRHRLIDQGLDPVEARFNDFLADEVLTARVQDTTNIMAGAIDNVGDSLDGLNGINLDPMTGALDTSVDAGAALDEQLRNAAGAMYEAQEAAVAAGVGQDDLNLKWGTAYGLLVDQLQQMGLTREAAVALVEQYGLIPESVSTSVALETGPALMDLGGLLVEVDQSSGTVTVNGNVTPASITLGELIGDVNTSDGTVTIHGNKLPADMTLEGLLGVIGGSAETVTINGNDYPADQIRQALLGRIGASWANVNIGANTYSATSALDAMIRSYNGRVMTVYTMTRQIGQAPVATGGDVDAHAAAALGRTRLAGGGSVIGPGTGTSDDVPAAHPSGVQFWLSNGEHVLTADDVLDLGGQQGAYALRAMIQAGMVKPLTGGPGMREGGAVGAAPSTRAAGPVTAVLAEEDRALLTAVAARPVQLEANGQVMARVVAAGRAELGGRLNTAGGRR